jgi:hypothetical protein
MHMAGKKVAPVCYFCGIDSTAIFPWLIAVLRPVLLRWTGDLITSYLFSFVSQPVQAGVYRQAKWSFALIQARRSDSFDS